MPASSPSPELPLPLSLLLLLLLSQTHGARAQKLTVQQTEGPLMLTAGQTLNLSCTLVGIGPPGGIRWYKGLDRNQPPIFNDRQQSIPTRAARIVPGSNTDYSIRISNIQPEDAGTYYCVKYKAGAQETAVKSGDGTEVVVIVPETRVQQPRGPIYVPSGGNLTLGCEVSDLFRPGPVKWFKGEGPGRKLIFPNNSPLSRVTRKEEGSNTDFTIFLHHVVPEDSGIHYCMKQKTIMGGETDFQSGHGTEVIVESPLRLSSPGLWVPLALNKIGAALFVLFLFRRKMPTKPHEGDTAATT